MELLDLPIELILITEEQLPTQADVSALIRSLPCLPGILQKRLYSRTKLSEVDFNFRWVCKMGNEGLASAMLSMGADILLSVDNLVSLMYPDHGRHDPRAHGDCEVPPHPTGSWPAKAKLIFNYDRLHELELGKKLGEYDTCKTPIDQALYDGNRELVQVLLADIRVELSASSLTAASRGGHEDMI
ncbi:hypothetical protein N7449_001240 [Penicillium cf. viridicatum]|uniref:Uncharacterized protein n=1 Tax=Penicillium cf. viridicatum TaxID=2972119 RepID=A0A9W9T998_9EURO|nr:hypothetical protein N7449_001240 [Penicillium cf. viridicatum]